MSSSPLIRRPGTADAGQTLGPVTASLSRDPEIQCSADLIAPVRQDHPPADRGNLEVMLRSAMSLILVPAIVRVGPIAGTRTAATPHPIRRADESSPRPSAGSEHLTACLREPCAA